MSALVCPVCRGEMRETIRQGVSIDTCSQCRGVWLDRGELEKLAGAISGGSDPGASVSGFWQQYNPAAQLPPTRRDDDDDHRRHRARRGDDHDDDAYGGRDDRRQTRRQPSKISRLMDFFD